jgi:hypothetical protein
MLSTIQPAVPCTERYHFEESAGFFGNDDVLCLMEAWRPGRSGSPFSGSGGRAAGFSGADEATGVAEG